MKMSHFQEVNMLRSFFIYLSKAAWARKIVTGWPFVRRMALRFIAGDKLEDALKVILMLNGKGINATLDHLGEHTTNANEASQATQDILKAIDEIERSGVRANISVKLTQIGLALDPALCAENLRLILEHAWNAGNFIRIDMEDSSVTQVTLDILHQMRRQGYQNVGIVIQAYLYRSEADIEELNKDCTKVRLCKGAYKEPAKVAYPQKRDVDSAYDRLTELLFRGALGNSCPVGSQDGKVPPFAALATHDEKRIIFAKDLAKKLGLPTKALEFQMLHGIRRDLQEQLIADGYSVRIYVPYGTQWYPYFMRRLAERPANVWFIVSNFFRK
jgi:proline dehydrogenase